MHKDTSWEEVHKWYESSVGKMGHYYHTHVIFPRLLKLMGPIEKILDVGCGQGVLSRCLPPLSDYVGLDNSPSLIAAAKSLSPEHRNNFFIHDAKEPFSFCKKEMFSHAVMILSMQNMAQPASVCKNIAAVLKNRGKLFLILNHPCFRIPRHSSWEVDKKKKLQSRRMDCYMSFLEIPIQAHPSQNKNSKQSISFHHPLEFYSKILHEAGFVIELLEEWCSDKKSEGGAAYMENRARKEFPLFLAIVASKLLD